MSGDTERGLLELARREAAGHPLPACSCGHSWPRHDHPFGSRCSVCGCPSYQAETLAWRDIRTGKYLTTKGEWQ